MIIEFQSNRKVKNKKKLNYKPKTDKEIYDETVEVFDQADIEAILRGSIMNVTGQNTILGIDYSLQREEYIRKAKEYSHASDNLLYLLEKAELNEKRSNKNHD